MSQSITDQIRALMNTADSAPAAPAAPAEVQDGAAVIQWETPSGRARAAFTARGRENAPAAVKKAEAAARTLSALMHGRYMGFAREAHEAMTASHRKAFAALYPGIMAANEGTAPEFVVIEGVKYRKAGKASTEVALPATLKKEQFRAICKFLSEPVVLKGKKDSQLIVDKPLTKSKQWISDMAAQWLESNPA